MIEARFTHNGGSINAKIMSAKIQMYLETMHVRGYHVVTEREIEFGHVGPVEVVLTMQKDPEKWLRLE